MLKKKSKDGVFKFFFYSEMKNAFFDEILLTNKNGIRSL